MSYVLRNWEKNIPWPQQFFTQSGRQIQIIKEFEAVKKLDLFLCHIYFFKKIMTSILFKFSGTADIFTKKFGKMINHNNDKPNGFIVKFLISVSQSMDLSVTLKVHQGWDNFRLLKALYKWWKMLFISRCSLYSLEIYIFVMTFWLCGKRAWQNSWG